MLNTTETVTLQGGVGNPQNIYTGAGQNVYLTNDSSAFGVRQRFPLLVPSIKGSMHVLVQ